jgi:hypothetical protein
MHGVVLLLFSKVYVELLLLIGRDFSRHRFARFYALAI